MTHPNIRSIRSLLIDSRVLTTSLFFLSGLVLLVPIRFITNPYTVILPVAILVAATVSGIYHFSNLNKGHSSITKIEISVKQFYIYWFIGTASIIILYYSHGFARTNLLNGLLLCLYLIPVLLIATGNPPSYTLFLLFSTGILHRGLIYFSNPLAYGVDPHIHYKQARLVAESGGIDILQGSKALYIPFYYIMGAVGSLSLNIPVRQGTMFLTLVTSITLVSTLIVYYLTSIYWGNTVGLVSATLYLASDYAIGGILTLGTTQLGLLFFSLVIYSVSKYLRTGNQRSLGIFLFSLGSLLFTHQATTFVAVISVVGGLCVIAILYGYRQKLLNISLLMGGILFFDWIVTDMGDGRSFLDWILGNLILNLQGFSFFGGEMSSGGATALEYTSASPMASTGYLHVIPMGFLFFLAAFGMLYWIHIKEKTTINTISLLTGGIIALLVLIFAGSILDLPFVPSRWFMHLYILLAVPAGVGLVGVLNLLPNKLRTQHSSLLLCCLIVLLLPYIALMGGNLVSAIDDPVFNNAPGAERKAYTDSEVTTIYHASIYLTEDTEVYGDSLMRPAVGRYYDSQTGYVLTINSEAGSIEQTQNRPTMIINRAHMYSGKAIFDITNGETRRTVRGEVPLTEKTMKEYSLIYQAEGEGCAKTQCGLYLTSG